MENKIGYLICRWLLKKEWLRLNDEKNGYVMFIDKYWLFKGFWGA